MVPEEVQVIQDEQKDTGNVRKSAELKQVRIETSSVARLKEALYLLLESFNEEMDRFAESDLKRVQKYAVDVTLDPDTAHPELILSPDGKQVRQGAMRQTRLNNPERFDYSRCVLGREGFSSGKIYFEVQVREKTKWDLGVTLESAHRKGKIIASPQRGHWIVWLRNRNKYEACDSPPVPLTLKRAPQKVGVFVDYDDGLVSFYAVEAKSLIYSFTGQSFTGKLFPFFSPAFSNAKNSAPLIITPVQQPT